jgi:hypothetical protein
LSLLGEFLAIIFKKLMNDRNQSDINTVLQNGYSIEIEALIRRGWDILQMNLRGFILYTLVIAFAIVLGAFGFSITLISAPIGILIFFLMSPFVLSPLAAGYIIVAFKLIEQQSVEFLDFFKGFKNNYFPSIFSSALVIEVFTTICRIPGQVLSINIIGAMGSKISEPRIGLMAAFILFSVVGPIIAAVITLFYSLTVPLVVAKKMQFWPAMEASRKVVAKRWFSLILLSLVLALINVAGLLACGIGLLLTSPLTACVVAAAYEHIFGLPSTEDSFA